jgi:hypothetical protein
MNALQTGLPASLSIRGKVRRPMRLPSGCRQPSLDRTRQPSWQFSNHRGRALRIAKPRPRQGTPRPHRGGGQTSSAGFCVTSQRT